METRAGMFKYPGSYSLADLGFQQLLKGQRAEAMREFCVDVAGGKTWQTSFAARFGQTPEAFYTAFEATRSSFRSQQDTLLAASYSGSRVPRNC